MHRTVMSSSHPSGLLTVVLGTALMVTAPIAMGWAAMQDGHLRPSDAQPTLLADGAGSSAAAPEWGGKRSRIVVSPRRYTAPITLW
jgi:hypothetical protein